MWRALPAGRRVEQASLPDTRLPAPGPWDFAFQRHAVLCQSHVYVA